MIRITRTLKFDDLAVTIQELTVSDIRAWLSEPPAERGEVDLVADLLNFDGLSLDDLVRFTDLTRETLIELPPSCLAKIAGVVKELNGCFFQQYLPTLTRVRQSLEDHATSTSPASPAASLSPLDPATT